MNILVTGAAGFIGFHLATCLIKEGHTVVGIDNINDYYDPELKIARLKELGLSRQQTSVFNTVQQSGTFANFMFVRCDLEDAQALKTIFELKSYHIVCHLAAQAGVRYSLEFPDKYIKSNIVGFFNILECCKQAGVDHLIYASSSSVYGNSEETPFKTTAVTDQPISLYAASKKSNELMAYTYSHLYDFKTTGLRFFTVYGPWGRPDMAYYKFTESMLKNEKIAVFNNGNLERDFTYIDDIIKGIHAIIKKGFVANSTNKNYALYNIGNGKPVKLMDFISVLQQQLKKKALMENLPMQDGDVYGTWADIKDLEANFGFKPSTDIQVGMAHFLTWYHTYYKTDFNT